MCDNPIKLSVVLHSGTLQVFEYKGVEGMDVNDIFGDKLTNIFGIKGTASNSVVPYNPFFGK